MSAVDVLPYFETEPHKRKLSTLKKGNNSPDRELMPEQEKGRSRDIVAKQFGVSGRYIQTAKSIAEKLPELADQIRKGEMTITQGKVHLKRLERVTAFKKAGKRFQIR
jgi:UTP-glucose-1-phosphate uridylyltransferase